MSYSMMAVNVGAAILELQPQVYTTLRDDAMLKQLVSQQIFDGQATSTAVLPYVVLGEIVEEAADMLSQQGRDIAVTVHVYSTYKGNKEVTPIASRIIQLLNRVQLPMGINWYIAMAKFESLQIVPDPGQARHAVMKFRYRVHATRRTD